MLIIAYTHLEEYVYELCLNLAITKPMQLDMDYIANKLRLQIHYGKTNYRFGNAIMIERSTPQKEWQMFAHELAHFLLHVGNQLNMNNLFCQLQERQANCFAYHFCVPTFMLMQLEEVNVNVIANKFNVEYDFAFKRLEMYQSKFLSRRNSFELQTHQN